VAKDLPSQGVQFLLGHAKEDWVGFFAITSTLQKFYPSATSAIARRQAAVQLISDAWDHGLRPGELTSADPIIFVPWALSKQQSLEKVKQVLDKFGDVPRSDSESIWFDLVE